MQTSRQKKSYIVGLTGGIGSGKSTVSAMFAERGAGIIDADDISRKLVQAGSPVLTEIVAHFGKRILNTAGELDRKALREIIFSTAQEKNWLEALLHPAIRKVIDEQIDKSTGAYIILDVPLLVEQRQSGHYDFLDRVLVVDVAEETQIKRIKRRDGSSDELIKQIIANQASRQERLSQADDVIDNSDQSDDAKKALEQQVNTLHRYYLKQSMTIINP